MRFPLRLAADITKTKIIKAFLAGKSRSLVSRINLADAAASSASSAAPSLSGPAKTENEILSAVLASPAPMVWLAGGEPLLHPQIGHLARRIADHGRNVFVETDGTLLRQRIFSFRPVSRLFLCVRLHGPELVHDSRAGKSGAFRAAIEGIRAAKLSGFYVCALTEISGDTELRELAELRGILEILEVEGWIILPAATATPRINAAGELREARALIQNRGWEKFSRLLESDPPVVVDQTPDANSVVPHAATETPSDQESVQVS
jgi:MoaA/NifB/PqqE/SkfB family radical SAM enzyme